MIRKIVKSRRVSRARERIISLVTDSVTVQAIVLENMSTFVEMPTNDVLNTHDYSFDEVLVFFLNIARKGFCHDVPLRKSGVGSSARVFKHPSDESSNDLQHGELYSVFVGDLSLLHIISAFLYTLSPDGILALDSALKFGHESYFNFMKPENNLSKLSHVQGSMLNLPDCVYSSSEVMESLCQCSKCHCLSNSSHFQSTSRHGIGLSGSNFGASWSKWLRRDITPTNGMGPKHSVYWIDLLLAVCKAWRWADLGPGDCLKRVGPCHSTQNETKSKICLNPYHWSRVVMGNKIDGKIQSLANSSDPDIVCLGFNSIGHRNHDYCKSYSSKETNPNSGYPEHMNRNSIVVYRNTNHICLQRSSFDSGISHDSANKSTIPLLGDKYEKMKKNFCSSHLCKQQQKLHMDLSHWSPDLGKLKNVYRNTDCSLFSKYPSLRSADEELSISATPSTTSTMETSLENSELVDFNCPTASNSPSPLSISVANDSIDENFCLPHTKSNRMPDHLTVVSNAKTFPPPPPHHHKPWANISYWESHHHVGRRWYDITNRTLNIVYNDEDDKPSLSPKHRVHNENPLSYDNQSQNDCIYLSLLALYQSSDHIKYNCKLHLNKKRNRVISTTPTTNINSSSISGHVNDISMLSSKQCQECRHHHRHQYINLLKSISNFPGTTIHSSFYQQSSGWKQCYRLGNQGISLTLTTYGCIWLNNQALATNLPIFVSSPCLQFNDFTASTPVNTPDEFCIDRPVYRVPAEFFCLYLFLISSTSSSSYSPSCRPFSNNCTAELRSGNVSFDELHNNNNGLLHRNPVIHISLGKGWGPSYRRPDVTHCPARLEVWINLEHLLLYSLQTGQKM
ncbi:unnamed protein product [Heterobilharzia americana]|nr:unnamed protein product [Heterobilharzia americana]